MNNICFTITAAMGVNVREAHVGQLLTAWACGQLENRAAPGPRRRTGSQSRHGDKGPNRPGPRCASDGTEDKDRPNFWIQQLVKAERWFARCRRRGYRGRHCCFFAALASCRSRWISSGLIGRHSRATMSCSISFANCAGAGESKMVRIDNIQTQKHRECAQSAGCQVASGHRLGRSFPFTPTRSKPRRLAMIAVTRSSRGVRGATNSSSCRVLLASAFGKPSRSSLPLAVIGSYIPPGQKSMATCSPGVG